MKIKTIIIFTNGSSSFYTKNFFFDTLNQYLFSKKSDKNFILSKKKKQLNNINNISFLNHHKKYF
jgi:hypothetical protein